MPFHQLLRAILSGITKVVNVKGITLDEAPEGYRDFDKGAAVEFVIDPHGLLPKAA